MIVRYSLEDQKRENDFIGGNVLESRRRTQHQQDPLGDRQEHHRASAPTR